MKKNKKTILILSLVSLLLLIPVGTVAAPQFSSKGMRNAPPFMRVDNDPDPVKTEPYPAEGQTLVDDIEKECCLGYLINFKNESIPNNGNIEEAERIAYKNFLIQEYREYVDNLHMQLMPTEKFQAHFDHLMDMFGELLVLEPDPTPQEQLETDIHRALSSLEEKLYYSEVQGEDYIKGQEIHLEGLKQSVKTMTALQETYGSHQVSFEQAQQEYTACLEIIRTACPSSYLYLTDPIPEPEEYEQLDLDMQWVSARIKAKLYCCDIYGEDYVTKNHIRVKELKQSLEAMTSLHENHDMFLEQAQQEYAANMEVLKSVSPSIYALAAATKSAK